MIKRTPPKMLSCRDRQMISRGKEQREKAFQSTFWDMKRNFNKAERELQTRLQSTAYELQRTKAELKLTRHEAEEAAESHKKEKLILHRKRVQTNFAIVIGFLSLVCSNYCSTFGFGESLATSKGYQVCISVIAAGLAIAFGCVEILTATWLKMVNRKK
jgi:ABC-type transport system involved in cytochrome bd biosynthesis fused ATPase/permease subunit